MNDIQNVGRTDRRVKRREEGSVSLSRKYSSKGTIGDGVLSSSIRHKDFQASEQYNDASTKPCRYEKTKQKERGKRERELE